MIGTALVEELVQSVVLTHRIKGFSRASLLLLAAPENGKTTIATAATAKHVRRIAVISGRSILREMETHKEAQFLLFNDLTAIRALSPTAVALLIVLLNQITQGEKGVVAFAGKKETEEIGRVLGVVGCLPFKTFVDHRSRWRELGFISRMIPFAYQYSDDLVAKIKDSIDAGANAKAKAPTHDLRTNGRGVVEIACSKAFTRTIRLIADKKAKEIKSLGIRLLANYHALTRAHALLYGRTAVSVSDIEFLRAVDTFVSIDKCEILDERQLLGIYRGERRK